MESSRRIGMILCVAAPALVGCDRSQSQDVELEESAPPPKTKTTPLPETTPEPSESEPKSFIIVLPDGRKAKVSPDMTRFQHNSMVGIDDIQLACERAAKDAQQKGIPLRDRNIRILVGVKSAYFDEKKKNWVRYKHEPEPVFDVLKIGELGTVEFEPPVELILMSPRPYTDGEFKPPLLYSDREVEEFQKRLDALPEKPKTLDAFINALGIDRKRLGHRMRRIGAATEWHDYHISSSYSVTVAVSLDLDPLNRLPEKVCFSRRLEADTGQKDAPVDEDRPRR